MLFHVVTHRAAFRPDIPAQIFKNPPNNIYTYKHVIYQINKTFKKLPVSTKNQGFD